MLYFRIKKINQEDTGFILILQREERLSKQRIAKIQWLYIVVAICLGIAAGAGKQFSASAGLWAMAQIFLLFPAHLSVMLWVRLRAALIEVREKKLHHHFLLLPDIPKEFYLLYVKSVLLPFRDNNGILYISMAFIFSFIASFVFNDPRSTQEAGAVFFLLIIGLIFCVISCTICFLIKVLFMNLALGAMTNLGKNAKCVLQDNALPCRDFYWDKDSEIWE